MTEILKNGKFIEKKLKETFGNIEVYEFDRLTDGRRNGTREVYKVSDQRNITDEGQVNELEVGVLPTERFYFLFPWKACYQNGNLDFNQLSGLMEIAHGKRAIDKKNTVDYAPFQPPEGKWQIHWVCPHGSIANGKSDVETLNSRIFGTSTIEGGKGEHCYYGLEISKRIDVKLSCQKETGKFKDPLKYVSGTVSDRTKIMNYRLDKFKVGTDFDKHFSDAVGLVQCSEEVGMVITRNREIKLTSLEDMLKSIKKWGFPTNLVFSSCRMIYPQKVWDESSNNGPLAIEVLEGFVNLPRYERPGPNGPLVKV